jgi:hypothetical protein
MKTVITVLLMVLFISTISVATVSACPVAAVATQPVATVVAQPVIAGCNSGCGWNSG